ncbi:hypothetical protein [Edaphobacter flagellatus]|uniref:hypothetical protein n=1 Tax=Edaphobacter flagellatus TaxID=1933044 RepID=UPI0021B49C43|nr:hypothetical protein [Edaphobacter flagellatus]
MPAKKVPAKKSPAKKTVAKKASAKKAAPKKSNIERLVAGGVILPHNVDKHNHKAINKLSPTEVKTLIKLRSKLGPLTAAASPAAGGDDQAPNFPV